MNETETDGAHPMPAPLAPRPAMPDRDALMAVMRDTLRAAERYDGPRLDPFGPLCAAEETLRAHGLVIMVGDFVHHDPRVLFLAEGPAAAFHLHVMPDAGTGTHGTPDVHVMPDVHGAPRPRGGPGMGRDVVDVLAGNYRVDVLDMARERLADALCNKVMALEETPQHQEKGFYRRFEKRRPGGGLSRGKRRR